MTPVPAPLRWALACMLTLALVWAFKAWTQPGLVFNATAVMSFCQ